jgi:hypothetical protein
MRICSVRSSLLILLCWAQSVTGKTLEPEDCLKGIKPRFESTRYRASIDVLNKHLSGILIVKTMEDGTIRTVFMNVAGATFFDISFKTDSYLYNKVMESLDKKAVKKTLAKDIGMIVMQGIYKGLPSYSSDETHRMITFKLRSKGSVRYTTTPDCAPVKTIENIGRRKKVVSINQFYATDNSVPDSIFVQHHTVHFTISLKQFHAAE